MGKERILGCEVQGWDSIVDNDIPNLKSYMGHYLISLLGKKKKFIRLTLWTFNENYIICQEKINHNILGLNII